MSGYYRYYDTPDGQDWHKKTYYLLRAAMPFGLYAACYDSMAITRPRGAIPVFERYIRVFSRPLIAVSLWSTTVFMSTRLRKKDDAVNHVLGWMPVAYYCSNFMTKTFAWGLFFPMAIIAYFAKDTKLKYPYMTFIPEVSVMRENADNTLFADYFVYTWNKIWDKDWMTIEDAIKKGIVESREDAVEKKLVNYRDGSVRGLITSGEGYEHI